MDGNDEAGQVAIEGGNATLTFTRVLKHSPDVVWKALTDPEAFGAWYNARVVIDPRVGGIFEVFSGPFHWTGPIISWEPPRLFAYEHNHVPCEQMPNGAHTIVRWELTPLPEGTRLVFTQSKLQSTAGFAPGTHVVLDRLMAQLDGRPLPDFGTRFSQVESLYEVWNGGK
jgi:uncharacterized protein YndB with AHSA1/START domain